MALNVVAKATSANSNTPSKVITRQEVAVARPTASSARAEALKARLTQAPPPQPVASRPAKSSARAEEFAKLNKFQTPPPQTKPSPVKTSARALPVDMSAIELPPSGLAPGQSHVQTDSVTEQAEAPTEATSEASLSPQAVSLARKEIQLRKAQQELKAAQEAWKQEQASYIRKDTLTSDTLKVLSEAGITPDKLVELQINQAAPKDPQQILLDKIADLEAKLQGVIDPENGTLAKRDQEAYNQTVEQIRSDASLLVDSDPRFGTIKSEGQISEVVKLITDTFNDPEDGELLDVEEAARLVEEKLRQRLDKQYERLQQYEWLKAKREQQSENTAEASPAQQPQRQPKINTLTNAGTATRPLSARDRAVMLVQQRLDAARGK